MSNLDHADFEPSERFDLADDLTPSLQQHEPYHQKYPQQKPWKLDRQYLIAFFGGVFSITYIYYQNSIRLDVPQQKRDRILVAGLIGFLTVIVFHYLATAYDLGLDGWLSENRRVNTIFSRVVACILYLCFIKMLTRADREYSFAVNDQEAYSSLLLPGLFAVFALGTLQNVIVFYIVQILMTF